MINMQSFYEYVILRDVLAFILPGGISLAGIYMIAQAIGIDRWQRTMPFLSSLNSFLSTSLIILTSFLLGHVWDMVYRLTIQKKPTFQRDEKIKEILIGEKDADPSSAKNHLATQIRLAVGQFLNIDWKKTPVEQWVDAKKAHDMSVLLSYWIEEEDPKIFGVEVGRPIVQAHFLVACGMAFNFFGICNLLVLVLHLIGLFFQSKNIASLVSFDFFVIIGLLILASWIFGRTLIKQGLHKRDVIVEHAFRVFYVIWQKRLFEQKTGLKSANNRTRSAKSM